MKETLLSGLKALGRLTPTILLAAGVTVVAIGVGMIYRPAGVIAAGVMLTTVGIVMTLGGDGR